MVANTRPLRCDESELVINDIEVGEMLNECLASVFTLEDTNGTKETLPVHTSVIPLNARHFLR